MKMKREGNENERKDVQVTILELVEQAR